MKGETYAVVFRFKGIHLESNFLLNNNKNILELIFFFVI